MTLPSGGPISMSQVNTELGRSSTATVSLNESAVRGLAGIGSGSLSMWHLLGKSAYLDQLTLTNGYGLNTDGYSYFEDYYGFSTSWFGSLSKLNFVPKGINITGIYTTSYGYTYFSLAAATSNAGWTTMKIGSESYNRASASFYSGSGYSYWYWTTTSSVLQSTPTGNAITIQWT